MKSWSISKQVIVLALLPALFVGFGLAIYFTNTQIEYISETLRKHGESIASQIAPAAEYAIFSGNTKFLEPALKNALSDRDVIAITVEDKNNKPLISLREENSVETPYSLWRNFIKTRILSFRAPIISQEVAIEDINTDLLQDMNSTPADAIIIGYVELQVTTYFSDAQKISSLNKAIILTIVILVAGFILAIRVSRQIAIPVMLLTNTVRKIASGDFRTRVTQDAPGELGVLESYVNSMADELQSYQEDMETRINDFTRELQQTLEELELRNAELDITRSNALAASRAKSEFLANMSHEIRTPLCGIMGFSELIDNTVLDEQQKDYITTIRKSAGNLLNIIDDILDLSKIESGKLEISPVEFNLLEIIEEVIDLLSPAAYEKNIELIYNLHVDTPRQIEADPVRIRQVLINLIGNAIKFTEKGRVYLEIENAPEKGLNGIRFSVTDTGIGMSLSSKKTLFHAFTQADTSITRRFGGTGLGLVISRKLTLLMKGSIDFDSVENEGSHFWFRVPVLVKKDKNIFGDGLSGVRVALTARTERCMAASRSMLKFWGCEVICHSKDSNTEDTTADITISCLTLDDLARIRAGEATCNKIAPDKPHLAIISSNKQEDINLVSNCDVSKVVFFASSQNQIYNAICILVCNASTPNRCSTVPVLKPPTDWSNVHVLVVDDNAINRRLAEIILRQNNAQVVTASSGETAIKLLEDNTFDIIFMDLHMPGMDGYAATKRIRQLNHNPEPVIIALTANAMPAERVRIYESGMNDIMIKPISEEMMNNVISKWLNNTEIEQVTTCSDEIESAIFSITEAEKFTAGNTTLAIELTTMLKNELPDYQKKISQALDSEEYAELKTQVHKLHGATRCCGTPALREAAEYMESVIDNAQHDELATAAARLSREISRLLDYQISAN